MKVVWHRIEVRLTSDEGVGEIHTLRHVVVGVRKIAQTQVPE